MSKLDRRERQLVEQLDAGETYSRGQITRLFHAHTDIRQEDTVTKRLKSLRNRGVIEVVRPGKFKYVGDNNE